jgi:hypothetical protein
LRHLLQQHDAFLEAPHHLPELLARAVHYAFEQRVVGVGVAGVAAETRHPPLDHADERAVAFGAGVGRQLPELHEAFLERIPFLRDRDFLFHPRLHLLFHRHAFAVRLVD